MANTGCFRTPPVRPGLLWETDLPVKRPGGWALSVCVTKGSDGNVGFSNHSALCPPLSGVPSGEAPAGGPWACPFASQ